MEVWFLLGLSVGLTLLVLYWLRLNTKLKRLIRHLKPDVSVLRQSPTTLLTRTIATTRQSHAALEQEHQSLRQLVQFAPIGFLQIDEENQLMSCNAKACELLGIEQFEPAKPRLFLELVRSYELDALIEETRRTQQPCQSEWVFHLTDADFQKLLQQQPLPLRGFGFPLAAGWVGVFLESREEVTALGQQRDRWISDVAHELKTPLTSIRLVAETLQARLEPPTRDWVDRLLKETLRLSSLVQDLLDLNQLQAHPTARLAYKLVDLPWLIRSAWISLEPLAREKQIQLEYHGPDGLLIQVDEARMHRVLLNLFDNSIKYSPAQQRIQVQLALLPDPEDFSTRYVHLDVIDAGSGFPEPALPYVFDRFFRADPSRTRLNDNKALEIDRARQQQYSTKDDPQKAGSVFQSSLRPENYSQSLPVQLSSGSGLGLAIVKQIIEAHHGTVKASNHPETGGAWLQIVLPSQTPQSSSISTLGA
jgi:two-component system, OmpR family, phosphate regulon sensor histidine kinase PhoR